MIRRKKVRNSDDVKITFVLPATHPQAPTASVVGDFNDWDSNTHPLKKRSNGTYSVAVTLKSGQRYTFRYMAQDGTWFNVGDADTYEPNEFGSEDGVLLT